MKHTAPLVQVDEIVHARTVIAGRVHRTPLLSATALGRAAGVSLYLKAENLQKTGSFKPRGVFHKLWHLSPAEKRRGLVTVSAGNHGQALAYGAAVEGVRCVVIVPSTASPAKLDAIRGYGAEVMVSGSMPQAFTTVREVQAAQGLTLVHPYDDPDIIAGQGTVGLEILEDLPDVDAVVVPIGGGGLIAGIAMAVKHNRPQVKVFGVEPRGAATLHRALQQGKPVWLDSLDTVADGLTAPVAGTITLPLVQQYVDEVVLVSDAELADAVCRLLERTKLLAEPAGAAGVAALLAGRIRLPAGARVAAVLSGGNVDQTRLKSLLPGG